jgi:hypothetical protein
MAYVNTDIQQVNNVILLIPLTIAARQMVRWRSSSSRSTRTWRCSLGTLPLLNFGDACSPAHVPPSA